MARLHKFFTDRWLILLGAFLLAVWFANRPMHPPEGGSTYRDIRVIEASGNPVIQKGASYGL